RSANADLTYLSVCETTLTTAELADEAIHVTSALQLAGYRGVVGTLWATPDAVAQRAARLFYAYHAARGSGSDPAHAVRLMSLELRRRYPDHPSAWAAYHHVGV
ncbi:MAG TPA: CHAT domain-containing protein, partial [Pseudonocardiaceae bacterium]